MKTRILAMLLVVIMAVVALASCTPPAPQDCVTCVDNNNDKKCDVCGKDIVVNPGPDKPDNPAVDEIPDITWNEKVSLLYMLTTNSNDGELPAGCKRYMVGDDAGEEDAGATFYDTIQERNEMAAQYASVEVAYDYTSISNGWSGNIKTITNLATQGSDKGRPDIICNFVYDMMVSTLQSCFHNLYSQTVNSAVVDDGELRNYFAFATKGEYDPEYVDRDTGYMVEYMQSLSLSRDRMYLLASDYFTDLVRAFFVVPVNITLLEQINPNESNNPYITAEDKEDGKYTIDEFYALVDRKEWNYEAVKAFSTDVYEGGQTSDPLDGVRGFAVSTDGGLGASGLLYTTSITIIEREYVEFTFVDDQTGVESSYWDFVYEYPDENSENAKNLAIFVENLASLFGDANPGVVAVGNSTNTDGTGTQFGGGSALDAILERFSDNKLLFGGIICVGALEDPRYSEMVKEKENKFGVVPVPLYRENYFNEETGTTEVDDYLTQIHSLGKVAGISIKSQKFAPVSAYINYLSLNSSDILDDYYNYTLTQDVAGGGEIEGTADMLAYIRAHVRTSFDKAFEDAIAKHEANGGDSTLNSNKWHNLILHANFQLEKDAITTQYKQLRDLKNNALQSIEDSYVGLPF